MKVINVTLLLGLLGSIATIYFGVLKPKIENDILFKQLFETFNERYDDQLRKVSDFEEVNSGLKTAQN
jgi:hypothetical protein